MNINAVKQILKNYSRQKKFLQKDTPEIKKLQAFVETHKNNKDLSEEEIVKLQTILIEKLPKLMRDNKDSAEKTAFISLYLNLSPNWHYLIFLESRSKSEDKNKVQKTANAFCDIIDLLKKINFLNANVQQWLFKLSVEKVELLASILKNLDNNKALSNSYDVFSYLSLFVYRNPKSIALDENYKFDPHNSSSVLFELLQIIDADAVPEYYKKLDQIVINYCRSHCDKLWVFAGMGEKSDKDIYKLFNLLLKKGLLIPQTLNVILESVNSHFKFIYTITDLCELLIRDQVKFTAASFHGLISLWALDDYNYILDNVMINIFANSYDVIKAYIPRVLDHTHKRNCFNALVTLAGTQMLTPENFEIINERGEKAHETAQLMGVLKNIWNHDIADIIRAETNPAVILKILEKFNNANMQITREEFNLICEHKAFLINNDFFDIIPDHLFTRNIFNHVIQICREADNLDQGRRNILNFGRNLLLTLNGARNHNNIPVQQQRENDLNYGQSTHNKEVHASVSESALRLMNYYGEKIKTTELLNQVINEIKVWARSLPDLSAPVFEKKKLLEEVEFEIKQAAAKRAIFNRGVLELDFVDKGSDITMKQMFALYWLAAHDEAAMNRDRKDGESKIASKEAENFYINALYEVQREYCFTEENNKEYDTGGLDKSSCSGGTFNKLAEKFTSVHPLVDIRISTMKMAEKRLPFLVREILVSHLTNKLNEVTNLTSLDKFMEEFERVKKDGAGEIWTEINITIENAIIKEFGNTLFARNEALSEFVELGQYVRLDETEKKDDKTEKNDDKTEKNELRLDNKITEIRNKLTNNNNSGEQEVTNSTQNNQNNESVVNVSMTKSEDKDFLRYHPFLATLAEAEKHYEEITSDHVPFLVSVPWDENNDNLSDEIRIVSWNVLETDEANGFSPINKDGSFNESEEQKQNRFSSIVKSLKKFVDDNKPHFITLQELKVDGKLIAKIKGELGEAWEFEKTQLSQGGVLTLYNKEYFTIEGNIRAIGGGENILEGNVSTFKSKTSDASIEILNVHAGYSDLSYSHEKSINDFIKDKNKNIKSIVIGDFNCSIAPIVPTPQIITTSATTPKFRRNLYQGAAAIDGCFYSESTSSKKVCKQAACHHLNPNTGKRYTEAELQPIKVDQLPELQKKEIEKPRMLICVDESYKSQQIIKNQYTLDQYQEILQAKLVDATVQVREARDLNNESYVAVTMLGLNFDFIQKHNNSNPNLIFTTTAEDVSIIFVKKDNLQDLENVIRATNDPEHVDIRCRAMIKLLLKKICNHEYDVNRGGIKIYDVNKEGLKTNDKTYSHSAAKIIRLLENVLKTDKKLTYERYDSLILDIELELYNKRCVTAGLFGFGGREQTTVDLYNNILKLSNCIPVKRDLEIKEKQANTRGFLQDVKLQSQIRYGSSLKK